MGDAGRWATLDKPVGCKVKWKKLGRPAGPRIWQYSSPRCACSDCTGGSMGVWWVVVGGGRLVAGDGRDP